MKSDVPFIRGPLDYELVLMAFDLVHKGHSAAKILLHLYFERGKRRLSRDDYIPFSNFCMKKLGVSRQVKCALLRMLETYQLVSVIWHKGGCPLVKILDREINWKRVKDG